MAWQDKKSPNIELEQLPDVQLIIYLYYQTCSSFTVIYIYYEAATGKSNYSSKYVWEAYYVGYCLNCMKKLRTDTVYIDMSFVYHHT